MTELVPVPLQQVLEVIDSHPRARRTGSWGRDKEGRWSLSFLALLSVAPTEFISTETAWYLVIEDEAPRHKITIYPASDGGITCTFPHQAANLAGPREALWRTGNPCVERPEAAFKRDEPADEPKFLGDRLSWRILRLLSWIDAAASGNLLAPGDPFELPSLNVTSTPVLGFTESRDDMLGWSTLIGTWGYAVTGAMKGALGHRQILGFTGTDMKVVKSEPHLAGDLGLPVDALWVLLPNMPVIKPWQAAGTWRELTELMAIQGVDLTAVFREAGSQTRRQNRTTISRLLIGFPLQEKVGKVPDRIHWVAAENIGLSGRDTSKNGFRPTERNRSHWDVNKPKSQEKIRWIKTSNWASDQLRTRGSAEDRVQSSRVLLIGAGAIGSAVAENLARAGVRQIGIVDDDIVEVGNLSRHTLGLSDCGYPKASALAARLENCGVDVSATPYKTVFPPEAQKTVAALQNFDVVVDCTGSDEVLQAMANFDWLDEKVFVSLSIGWGARQFFCYSASETSFPVLDALDRFSANMSYRPDIRIAAREGIGCWHPVFPATADDVGLWCAVGAKFVRSAIMSRSRTCKVYTLGNDATVSVADA